MLGASLSYPQWPIYPDEAIEAVVEILRSGQTNQWSGDTVNRFQSDFARAIDTEFGIACSNGSVALELALLAIGLRPGDEVVVPPRTFIASASSVAIRGGIPVWADIDPVTQNIDPEAIRAVLTPRTRAILCVHHAGCPCDMDSILAIAREHDLKVIEDCAQAHGARYRGRPVGSFGDVCGFSFCQDKIISTGGEGGFVGTNDPTLWERIWSYRDHGRNHDRIHNLKPQPTFPYLCDSLGTNFRMTAMQAAIGSVGLEHLDQWVRRRRVIAEQLDKAFGASQFIRVPVYPGHLYHSYFEYYVFVESENLPAGWTPQRIVTELQAAGVRCNVGSCPEIYREAAFRDVVLPDGAVRNLAPQARLPVARRLGNESLKLSLYPSMSDDFVNQLARVIETFFDQLPH